MGAVRQVLAIIQPRALARGLTRGSWVLLGLIAGALLTGLKRAISKPGGTPESSAAGDRVEQAGLAVLVFAIVCGALGGIGSILLFLLRPYMTAVSTVLVVGWFTAALTAEAFTRTENDHEESAGERPQESTPAEGAREAVEDPWPGVRDLLRTFVEERVMAGAAGHTEGLKGRGARVDDLLAEQQQAGGLPGMERKDMIELLERCGITVRPQMKFQVLENTQSGPKWVQKTPPGIHVEDLATDLGRRPRLPAHLVPAITPRGNPVSPPDPAHIPAARAAAE